ncbi:hypothetical protein BHM03_00023606 [Ensete ventricosum]|nr:hypothetical protein BHM03_00023606 [Ensete ventricosum]
MEDDDKHEKNLIDSSAPETCATDPSDALGDGEGCQSVAIKSVNVSEEGAELQGEVLRDGLNQHVYETEKHDQSTQHQVHESRNLDTEDLKEVRHGSEEVFVEEQETDPVFDGTETPELEPNREFSSQTLDLDPDVQVNAWPEKAVALKNFVKEKGSIAVSTVLRRLSGKNDEETADTDEKTDGSIGRNVVTDSKTGHAEDTLFGCSTDEPIMRGRIMVYTRLGCQDCKRVRSLFHQKRLKFVEINIDIFPTRKLELEKNTGSSAVPKVLFNDFLVGGLTELETMNDSGQLDEKIKGIFSEEPPPTAPLPPLPGEDDESGSGKVDELASIVRKMKESIILKDRFYKMRRFSNCFLGSEAVDFLSEDQYLEREEAVEFGRKLVSQHFFWHVLDENIFEDGNHLYRFLEHDPVIMTQCYNIPRGMFEVKPKPVTEIASRLRFLSYAIIEAYVSEDGKHVDYWRIHSCEEFKRYSRIIEELQRVDLESLSQEEKLAFFINLYNMMAIHATLTWGHPVGALERRKFFGDFKYVIGGCAYSLSAIHNGILRGNQRPPYNLTKPFGQKDKRLKVALPYPEPLVHFALVCGTRSGPALRCYSPGNLDKELMEAARDFIRNRGVSVDAEAKVASVTKILQWYSVDFGKNELEVLKHAVNYLDPEESEEILELLSKTPLKVIYQPYDWGLND